MKKLIAVALATLSMFAVSGVGSVAAGVRSLKQLHY